MTKMTPEGLFLVDKPQGLTSHDVVARVRGMTRVKRVGHAGTLDPMATGLLVLGIGRATKLLTYLVGADKTYTACIRLGQATTTDDAEGEITASVGANLSKPQIEAEVDKLRGDIEQVPSSVSAIKVDGKRAYARVRDGEEVTLKARPVTIHEFSITSISHPASEPQVTDVYVRIRCTSGTYIRALARDLGQHLGVSGHLTELRRTEVGAFSVENSLVLPPKEDGPPEFTAPSYLTLDAALMAHFPIRVATVAEAKALSYGQAIPPSMSQGVTGVLGMDGSAIALVENVGESAKPVLVLAPAS